MSLMLQPMPFAARHLVVVGSSIRKPLHVLKAYLDSLDWQEWPPHVEVHYAFVADWPDPHTEAESYLRMWVADRQGTMLEGQRVDGDYSDTGGPTHHWMGTAMARVGEQKNRLLRHAAELRASHVWLVDADLICDRTTFQSLWSCQAPIACAVYWTIWHDAPTPVPLQAAPQVWLRHPYILDGRGQDAAVFRRNLVQRQKVRVWGQGACTLLKREVLDKGIDFSYVDGIAREGMMAGEDRHFCIQAESAHVEMWADAWPDIFHIYHAKDHARIPPMQERLGTAHPSRAIMGMLVNVVLEAIVPVPHASGGQVMLAPTFLRGVLGRLNLLPEVEEALLTVPRGATTIVPVHFPSHYPGPLFRGTRRLVRLTLVDCKPWSMAPVLEEELVYGTGPTVWSDPTTYTAQQVQGMGIVAA